MGWTLERYLHASVYEFNEAARGYWRRWERDTAWLAREIVAELIWGNPHYEQTGKPRTKYEIMKLSMDPDTKAIEQRKEIRRPSKKELQEAENILKGARKDGMAK